VVSIRARPSRRGMMRRSGHHQAPPARIIFWKGGPAALDCLFEGVPVPGGTKIRCKHIIEGGPGTREIPFSCATGHHDRHRPTVGRPAERTSADPMVR